MAGPPVISVGIGLVIISLLLLVAYMHGSHEKRSIRSTPSIASKEDGVFTILSSMVIHATADEVFGVIVNYKDYSWSSNTEYAWDEDTPEVGSTGTITLQVEDFLTKTILLRMTHLDHKTKTIVECATRYPRWLLKAQRVLQVTPVEGHVKLCEFKASTTYEGIAAYYPLLVAKEELVDTQRRFAEDLKAFVEGRKL